MSLSVALLRIDEHALLRNLYPLYLHDLSEFGPAYALDAAGEWQPDYLPYWLSGKDEACPLLFRLDERPVGFAMVARAPSPYMTPGRDFRLSEFFVLRGVRKRGVGRRAACAVFDRFKGQWELSQLPENLPARSFWNRVVDEYTGGRFQSVLLDGDPGLVFDSSR